MKADERKVLRRSDIEARLVKKGKGIFVSAVIAMILFAVSASAIVFGVAANASKLALIVTVIIIAYPTGVCTVLTVKNFKKSVMLMKCRIQTVTDVLKGIGDDEFEAEDLLESGTKHSRNTYHYLRFDGYGSVKVDTTTLHGPLNVGYSAEGVEFLLVMPEGSVDTVIDMYSLREFRYEE